MKNVTLEQAVQILQTGGVIAYPTETCYGLGGDATNPLVIQKLYALKGRPAHQPISILISRREELEQWVRSVPPIAEKWIQRHWPGPLTLVFEASARVSPELISGTGKIAIRISSHPLARALCEKFGLPLTTTSANRSGAPSAHSPLEVRNAFGELLDGILEGGILPVSPGSTLVDVSVDPPKILREGKIIITGVKQDK